MPGKDVRLRRILAADRRTLIVPVDHAVTLGPVDGLRDVPGLMADLGEAAPDAVLAHRGAFHQSLLPSGGTGLINHLSAATRLGPRPQDKTLVCAVEDAVRLGADAVSVHITFGNDHEPAAIADLGTVASACLDWGMPLLAMAYPHGRTDPVAVAHAARIAAELGADIVKVPYTGEAESFGRVVEGCFVPVVVAGGSAAGEELLAMVGAALECGAAGACVGRAVFEDVDIVQRVRALTSLIHGGPAARRTVRVVDGRA